jgi:hypothetical protein
MCFDCISFHFLAVTTIAVAQAITMILILDFMALHLQEPGNFYSVHPHSIAVIAFFSAPLIFF